jgi:16S rRNA (uracil1498-N3)-methyltransferase
MATLPHTECAVCNAMPDRYFVETPIIGREARLEGAEAHHLANVMRAKPGQPVTLFDGSGAEFDARIEKVNRSTVDLAIEARIEVDRELARRITLAVALPKGDRQRWLVEKATELGVTGLVPLITARSVAQPVESALTRLRRAVIEASKQCGRNRLLEIAEAASFGDFVRQAATDAERWIAQPCATVGDENRARLATHSRELVVAIGPEGGFTDDEVCTALDAGFSRLDLGRRILRVETAAIAVAAWAALSGRKGPA